jgi:hypothetical protein
LIVLALLIGGFTRISRQSGPFDASVNRSFAAQGAVIATESNATASSVRHLMRTMPNLSRPALEADLDTLAAQTAQQATRAAALAAASAGDVEGRFATVFSDRAAAVQQLHAALDGLLGMHPLTVAGAPPSGGATVATPALLTSTAATNRIAAAGALLARSDRNYQALRRALSGMPGHARLPGSRWITAGNLWQIGTVATQVDLVATSTSLAVTHRLVLSAVRLSPPALPSPSGAATPGASMVSPTTRVTLSVVLTNLGTVDEPHAAVQFTLTPQPTGAAMLMKRGAAVASGGSVTLAPAVFSVKPGHSYQLTVAVVLPAGQTDVTGASLSELLEIAPST